LGTLHRFTTAVADMLLSWMFARVLCAASLMISGSAAYKSLSDDGLRSIPLPGSDFDIHKGALLAPILKPRVPGTQGSREVLQHFVNFFQNNLPEWKLEFQNSTWTTPATGNTKVPFVNLIATRDPPRAFPGNVGHLALVAHYDSKLTPEGFIGATDSAAPCAMLLHTARSLDTALTKKWAAMGSAGDHPGDIEEEKGIQIILLDGEEAFAAWTDTDSLYGARSLAAAWEETPHTAASIYHNPIDSISLFVLLDLLGASDPRIPSYFKMTHWAYQAMSKVEMRLRGLGLLKSSPNNLEERSAPEFEFRDEPIFLPESSKQEDTFRAPFVLDDHVPFMARGVDILHLIPIPFPRVWHTIEDDGEHLDTATTEDWATIVTAFAAEWMELDGLMTKSSPTDVKRASVDKSEL